MIRSTSMRKGSKKKMNVDKVAVQSRKFAWFYGMVWYGMVWYGMVWYGVVWYGMIWYGMIWYGMVWYGMVRYGTVWYGMFCYLIQYCNYLHVGLSTPPSIETQGSSSSDLRPKTMPSDTERRVRFPKHFTTFSTASI
jgi:hypothetical protein